MRRNVLGWWRVALLGLGCGVGVLLAGAGTALAGDRITYEEILQHLQVGSPQEDVIQLVREADEVVVAPEQLDALRQAGAKDPLLKEIEAQIARGETFSLDTVHRMLDEGRPAAEILDRVLSEGAKFQLTAQDRQALIRKKAGADVIKALEGNFEYPDLIRFTAEHRLYSVSRPRGWMAYAWYSAEGYVAVLSPETEVTGRDDFSLGFQIQTSMLWDGSPYAREPIAKVRESSQEAWFRSNAKLQIQALPDGGSKPMPMRVAGYPAAIEKFDLVMKGVPCHEWFVTVVADDVIFQLEMIAPRESFAEHEPTFRRMLRMFRAFPDRVVLERRSEALDPAATVTRFRDAVVQVQCDFGEKGTGNGTGFFVRSDGYVLTNHHVVCSKEDHSRCSSMAESALPRGIRVLWDKAVGPKRPGETRRSVVATLVDTVHLPPLGDVALLRVPPAAEPYRTIPLCPVGRLKRTGLVRAGDPVVAMGFPLPGQITPDEVMSTTGSVARFVTEDTSLGKGARAERLSYLYTTTQIQPGNSGGPSISLRTGGVVGINTMMELRQGQQAGYFGVCPIDEALRAFPQVKFYPVGKDLPPEGRIELGAMLVDVSNTRAARTELALALKDVDRLAPKDAANLYYQVGRCFEQMELWTDAEKAFSAALEQQEDHSGALMSLAYLQPSGQVDTATKYVERLVRVRPDDYWSYYHRAEFRRRAKRYEQALEDVTTALEMGGHHDAGVYRLQGLIHLDMDECGAGVAAYQRALEVDPTDVESKLGIVECAVRSKDVAGALTDYGRIAEEHPDEPRVHEVYGRFLLQQDGRETDAFESLMRAVSVTVDLERTPGPRLLYDTAELARTSGRADAAVLLARLLHGLWPGWRGSAHAVLGQRWLQDRPVLARAHLLAAKRQRVAAAELENLPEAPLGLDDVNAMVLSKYEAALLFDVMEESNLGFDFDFDPRYMKPEEVAQFGKFGWGPLNVAVANVRFRHDQMTGGWDLGRQVRTRFVSDSASAVGAGSWGEVTFENKGEVALTGFVLRYRYFGAGDRVLWQIRTPLPNRLPPLRPGESRTFPFVWHTNDALRRNGVNPADVKSMDFTIISARNAHYLRKIRTEGQFNDDHSVYRLAFRNESAFHLRDVWIRVDYVDGQGRPILGESGRYRGQPIHKVFEVEDLVLPPGETRSVSIPRLDDATELRALGFPSRNVPGASISVSVVEAVPFEPRPDGG